MATVIVGNMPIVLYYATKSYVVQNRSVVAMGIKDAKKISPKSIPTAIILKRFALIQIKSYFEISV